MNMLAKALMIFGGVLFCAGAVMLAVSKTGIPFGRLPGDVAWHGRNVKVFMPITSMIIVSLVLTMLLNLFSRFFRR